MKNCGHCHHNRGVEKHCFNKSCFKGSWRCHWCQQGWPVGCKLRRLVVAICSRQPSDLFPPNKGRILSIWPRGRCVCGWISSKTSGWFIVCFGLLKKAASLVLLVGLSFGPCKGSRDPISLSLLSFASSYINNNEYNFHFLQNTVQWFMGLVAVAKASCIIIVVVVVTVAVIYSRRGNRESCFCCCYQHQIKMLTCLQRRQRKHSVQLQSKQSWQPISLTTATSTQTSYATG